MSTTPAISADEMFAALLRRDSTYDGVFFVGVRTTGIFCRPTCPARKPQRRNVEFFSSVGEALSSGFRPCKRCRPMRPEGSAPSWLEPLLADVERDPARRWTDADLRRSGVDPSRVRRWFRRQHGMTFHAYQRARRLGAALGRLRHGDDLAETAFASGFESVSGFRDAFERLFQDAPGRSRGSTSLVMTRLATPLGPMVAGATEQGVCLLEFCDRRMLETQLRRLRARLDSVLVPGTNAHVDRLADELAAYFDGRLTVFTVPLVTPGTDFQRDVWAALLRIPFGETTSYERLAHRIDRPGAQRAVGRANGDNRIAIVIPCHRVVRSDGSLCGYGGGLRRKEFLLALEREQAPARSGVAAAPFAGSSSRR